MVDLHCSVEVESAVSYLEGTGVPFLVTSTIRPGSITISGNLSLHGVGLAVDFAGLHPSADSEVLAAIFHAFGPVEGALAELIYAGPQVSYNIKNGKRVGKYAQSIHHNHVHVGLHRGQLLSFTASPAAAVIHPIPDHEGEDMAEPVDALCAPGGGTWVLTRDGGIRAYKGAPFFGSYPALKPENRRATDPFVEIQPGTPEDETAEGYTLVNSGGAPYHFDAGVWAGIQRGEI